MIRLVRSPSLFEFSWEQKGGDARIIKSKLVEYLVVADDNLYCGVYKKKDWRNVRDSKDCQWRA